MSDSKTKDKSVDDILLDALRIIRMHLSMEVAFISEFSEDMRRFCYVDSSLENPPIAVNDSGPLEESYCQRVVDGRLPELIQDASLVPAALELPVTMALPVGAHLSVVIRLSTGRVYGTFCCFSSRPDFTLGERDIAIMRLFGDFMSQVIERQLAANRAREEIAERITSVLEAKAFTIVYQPIFDLVKGKVSGFETLTRFSAEPIRSPDIWFNEAAKVGLGEQLEMAVIEKVLAKLDHIPEGIYISLNVSPENISSGAITQVLKDTPLNRIVLELTEHVAIPDYSKVSAVLDPLRNQGLLLAIDDAGAGYASFRHILQLNPDLIKLDIGLIRNIDTDRKRRALAAALIRFAEETRSQIIAEGVETVAELNVLRKLGVNKVQGYLLGRPLPIANALERLQLF
ncbi:EAL domain-containing protein [Pseudanabaena sp. FACHB-2040]|uniref:sensor domain-containing phosphodiesterase n=1 Tax=Pseudanabaena sp. FACHB-2040 TaxID=2692859 RepID=UPI001F549EAE|nr:EAL domain-containing protein [Pseudanabaena sp. FACHB-2040]